MATGVPKVSPFLERVASARSFPSTRRLSSAEIAALEAAGNCADWAGVRVLHAAVVDPSRVQRCVFRGNVVFGSFVGEVAVDTGVSLPSGLFNSCVVDCVVEDDALIMVSASCAPRAKRRAAHE